MNCKSCNYLENGRFCTAKSNRMIPYKAKKKPKWCPLNNGIYYKETRHGFEYGNAKVTRWGSDEKKGWVVIGIESDKYKENKAIQVYITKTGKIRINSNGDEWFPERS